ncbi:winged helix-turn-helix transcriptional regulator [Fusobacterium simiae]|uniref:winged helix-turn-helix transcriptional regulator n=1 Tax=Fusobacterium TaxID=848 RepID=UPI00042A5EFC|nr:MULTISPECIES: winged helix-turn-helix transcriptional regulator [Fusobacterium]MDC7954263.1 winged helix-turn-helix transcriptional regulator [Fusobacterium simiae]
MERICKNITNEILEQNKDIFGVLYIQTILAGKWKIAILWFLKDKAQRYNEIKKFLKTVSQAALTKQLRELENDKIVNRKIYNEIPPKVEYSRV